MIALRNFFLSIGLIVGSALFGQMISCKRFAEVEKRIDAGVVVFVDLDDTLIWYPFHLGSEPWWQEFRSDNFQQIAGLLAHRLPVALVDPDAAKRIAQWQEQGWIVVGVTARETTHPAVENWIKKTAEQLASVGVYFTPKQRHLLHEGILFTGKGNKGKKIQEWLAQLQDQPDRVILVDDRLSDLADVESVLEAAGIAFDGLWFQALEGQHAHYRSDLAAIQLEHLLKYDEVLTNEAAKIYLEKTTGQL